MLTWTIPQLKLPSKLGRLPTLIGEPAGGSLTADQWLVFATIVAPIIIPLLWQEYLDDSVLDDPTIRAEKIATVMQAKKAAAKEAREKANCVRDSLPQASGSGRPQRTRRPTARAAVSTLCLRICWFETHCN